VASGEDRLTKKESRGLIIKSSLYFLAMIPAIFFCAGRLDYWQGWAFLGINGLYVVYSFVALSAMPGLVRERMKPGPGVKRWDVVFMSLYGPLSLGLVLFAAADAGRFGWTPRLPTWAYAVGWVTFVASYGLVTRAMLVNRWFSSVVRIQTDRGHEVVSSGPYRVVRHPGYVGGIGGALATPVMLGSLWGVALAGLIAVLLVVRTSLEDRTLTRELPGYADYAQRVRWRLVPGVW
jgi:protein-S-isoprenylcysteine O-methyltransferase Ste14